MELDDMLTADAVDTKNLLNESRISEDSKRVEQVMLNLGYEVVSEKEKLSLRVKKGKTEYTITAYEDVNISNETIAIPIHTEGSSNLPNLFNTVTDCIAVYNKFYDGGTVFQFKTSELQKALKNIVDKMLADKKFSLYPDKAAANKQCYVYYNREKDTYLYYVFVPVDKICNIVKNSKRKVNG